MQKKAGLSPAFFTTCFCKLGFRGTQTQNFPILHAAAVPLDLVRRVAKLQEVGNVVGRLAAPHAVAEHHRCFGFAEVKQAFTFLDVEDFLHDLRDVNWGRAFGRV